MTPWSTNFVPCLFLQAWRLVRGKALARLWCFSGAKAAQRVFGKTSEQIQRQIPRISFCPMNAEEPSRRFHYGHIIFALGYMALDPEASNHSGYVVQVHPL